jgi:hypothetical protein
MSLISRTIARAPAPADHQRVVRWALPVAMTEASFRVQPVAHTLLQDLGFRKAPVVLAIPDDFALVSDLKHAAGAWNQGHFAEIRSKGRKEFLGQPSRAEQPLTLRAAGDGDPGTARIPSQLLRDLHNISDGPGYGCLDMATSTEDALSEAGEQEAHTNQGTKRGKKSDSGRHERRGGHRRQSGRCDVCLVHGEYFQRMQLGTSPHPVSGHLPRDLHSGSRQVIGRDDR